MWSLLAPLGKPNRFSSILCNLKYCTHRQLSQSTGANPFSRQPWTEESDRKLRSLVQQGFKPKRIESEMSDHTYSAIHWRYAALKAGDRTFQAEGQRSWTAEEHALILEKRKQGLSLRDILSHLPGRSYSSIKNYTHRIPIWHVSPRLAKDFTEDELQRVIEMRLKEAKTYKEIARAMASSTMTIERLWRYSRLSTISANVRKCLWTLEENEHLLELHRRGNVSITDAARQFPSKSRNAVSLKIRFEGLKFPSRSEAKGSGTK